MPFLVEAQVQALILFWCGELPVNGSDALKWQIQLPQLRRWVHRHVQAMALEADDATMSNVSG
jgi:hypothetical protein